MIYRAMNIAAMRDDFRNPSCQAVESLPAHVPRFTCTSLGMKVPQIPPYVRTSTENKGYVQSISRVCIGASISDCLRIVNLRLHAVFQDVVLCERLQLITSFPMQLLVVQLIFNFLGERKIG